MKLLKIIIQIAVLYGIYFLGEGIRSLLNIPIPGSIIGLLLLFTALSLRIIPVEWIENGARFILVYLPLFFIPATVGVINYPDFLSWTGVLLAGIVSLSTLATMTAAGMVSQYFQNKRKEVH
ncbi:CidA/LrgA family protein [Halobacillus sp. A5]|uniref:CidA/LrgA family protein n=1 Tax=Halobacillus sp. A5 TaxID=2880263 RepID=UPI0020A6238C|nr:CidA/LrgA family holin-like protein [Halobacillus sp. A5]MCP3027196.1 CidA/LrgA family holin-like protein [Halobacillus sp. A5]